MIIIVCSQDEVEVHEPYVPESCTVRGGDKRASQSILPRVQLIITAERKRLGLAEQ